MENLKKKFSRIYDDCIEKIYHFIFLKVNSQEIAEDLCSETFLRGWESFKAKNAEIENPSAFLYQIARNLVVDHYREKGRTQVVSAESAIWQNSIIDPRTDLEENAILNSDIETVKQALVNLKENYQEVIIWRYLDEMSIPEIAKLCNKSEETTRVLIHRALKSLKNELDSKIA